ncbi:MAG: hypothetical protein ITG00_00180 [Flavobacterium sp.]|nr:hypothetical protein [Flavobacterium sp.]
MKYTIFLLLISVATSAQKTEIIDFSYRINSVYKVPESSKKTQLTVRQFNAELNGTIIVTGYVDGKNILVSAVKLEVPRAASSRRAASSVASNCDGDVCAANCRNKSEVVALICMGSCIILCQ